ncbi:hypothetical protein AZOA_06790 [Azoarcus sp. Aa7]|nr:hypothetical protein [Azoarcus sp. Aa7]
MVEPTGMTMIAPLLSVMTRSLPVTGLLTVAVIVAVPVPSNTVMSPSVIVVPRGTASSVIGAGSSGSRRAAASCA